MLRDSLVLDAWAGALVRFREVFFFFVGRFFFVCIVYVGFVGRSEIGESRSFYIRAFFFARSWRCFRILGVIVRWFFLFIVVFSIF